MPPVLTFYRSQELGRFTDIEAARFATLLPHLRSAVRLRTNLSGSLGSTSNLAPPLLEHIPNAAILLDGTGRLQHANLAARALLAVNDPLLVRAQVLVPAHRPQQTAFAQLVAACLGRRPQAGEMLLRRRDLSYVFLTATPVIGLAASGGGPRAIVVLKDPSAGTDGLAGRLVRIFGLSPREARVATLLAEGLTPIEIAVTHEVTLATVRTQIAAVYTKLEVRRQTELVRRLTLLSRDPQGGHQF